MPKDCVLYKEHSVYLKYLKHIANDSKFKDT